MKNSLSHSRFKVFPDDKGEIYKMEFKDVNLHNEEDWVIIKFTISNLERFIELFIEELKEIIKK